MIDEKPSINEVLKIVNEGEELERKDCYYEAFEKFLKASELFKGINKIKLSAKCLVAQAVNMIKYYLAVRDIEAFSPNIIDFYIKEINGIRNLELSKFDKYDIFISAYRELEKVFADHNMVEDENKMYYKRNSLYHKFYWQRAMEKDRKCGEKIMDFYFFTINLYLNKFCGHGEKPWRAVGWITTLILIFSVLFKCFNLIEFVDPGKTLCFWQSLYFSVITFTTLGYGDVLPIGTAGQIAVITEVTLGVLSLGLLLATLTRKFTK